MKKIYLKSLIVLSLLLLPILFILASSFAENNKSEEYIGSDTCASCHEEAYNFWLKTLHGKSFLRKGATPDLGCESCHGSGKEHADNPIEVDMLKKIKSNKVSDICLNCHKKEIRKNNWRKTIHSKEELSCVTCHNPYKNAEHFLRKKENELCFDCHNGIKLDFEKNSHHPLLEEKLKCSDCHNLHNSNLETAKTKEGDELCFKCHFEYKGPYVYTHEAITGGTSEGCKSCHTPHGSPNNKLLKVNGAGKGLCLQCHTDRINHGGTTCTECHKSKISGHNGVNCLNCHTKKHNLPKNCIECHNEFHGSNTDELLGGGKYEDYFNQ